MEEMLRGCIVTLSGCSGLGGSIAALQGWPHRAAHLSPARAAAARISACRRCSRAAAACGRRAGSSARRRCAAGTAGNASPGCAACADIPPSPWCAAAGEQSAQNMRLQCCKAARLHGRAQCSIMKCSLQGAHCAALLRVALQCAAARHGATCDTTLHCITRHHVVLQRSALQLSAARALQHAAWLGVMVCSAAMRHGAMLRCDARHRNAMHHCTTACSTAMQCVTALRHAAPHCMALRHGVQRCNAPLRHAAVQCKAQLWNASLHRSM